MIKYRKEVEEFMKRHYDRLSEKDKRSYAAVEAYKLGAGGQQYICGIFGCSPRVIMRGMSELESDEVYDSIRLTGGGPKRVTDKNPELWDVFWEILLNHTAGDPMNDEIKWTDLSVADIVEQFGIRGYLVSEYIVRQMLDDKDFVKRKAKKEEELKKTPDRNEQFENIASLIEEYTAAGDPVISIDVKKRAHRKLLQGR